MVDLGSVAFASVILSFFVDLEASAFCSGYAPWEGSFEFPRKTCLTEEFMKDQFDMDVFGKEPIPLVNEAKNLTYRKSSGEIVDMPLTLVASLGWESGHMVAAVVDILLREVLGVKTNFVCSWGSVHAMKLLGGCKNPQDSYTPCVVNATPQLDPPLAHVSVESWVTTPAERDEMNTYNIDLGMLGYYSKSGLFFDKKIAVEAFEAENLSLEWWQGFKDFPAVSSYFDTYEAITDDLRSWSHGSVAPRCSSTKVADNWNPNDAGAFHTMANLGMVCEDGWYFSPACAENKLSCIPVILAEYDWNGLVWMEAIKQHGYRFAITWVGASHSLAYSMRTPKKLMFYCATTSALCHEKPIVKMFADNFMPIGRPDLITSLRKVIWQKLPQVDDRVYEFLTKVNIPTEDLNELMSSYSKEIRPELAHPRSIDEFVPDLACRWLRNEIDVKDNANKSTGLNSKKWERWLPRTCQQGEEFDKVSGACRPCPPGEDSNDGRRCRPCAVGTFADEASTARCKPCLSGTWQGEVGGKSCTACPAGEYRGEKDRDGCLPCASGRFSSNEGSEVCENCPRGEYQEEEASTGCEKCPKSLTTELDSRVLASDCVCLEEYYLNCSANENTVGCRADQLSDFSFCNPCPEGMLCPGLVNATTVQHVQPRVKPGFYASEDSPYAAYECFHAQDQCVGGDVMDGSHCSGGRFGLQCHACPHGQRAGIGGACEDCEARQKAILPLAFIGCCFVLLLFYKLCTGKQEKTPSKTAMLGMLSIAAINTQMFSIVVSFSMFNTANWTWLSELDNYFALNLDTWTSSSCHFGHESMGPKYLPGLFFPVVATGIMITLWASSQILARVSSRFEAMKMDQTINALGVVLMTMYISVCKAVFNIFECRPNASAPNTLRSHDGFLCFGEDVQVMIPAAVMGALLYVGAFSSIYLWVIVKAPSKYQDSESFRLRTHFLLNKWHPEKWFWGILFVTRNLLCSLIPSMTTDGSVQVVTMFLIMFSYFLASATCSPWRDELSNKHDLIMVGALLMTLVVAQALQVPPTKTTPDGWFTLLQVASSLLFITALLICAGVLLQYLLKEAVLVWEKKKLTSSEDLPNLMKSSVSGEGSKGFGEFSVGVDGSKKLRKRISLASADEKVNDIYSTLSALSAWNGDDTLLDVVKQLEEELPSSDLRRLQWGMSIIGYHVLGDHSKRPSGIVLSPAASRNSRVSTRSRPSLVPAPSDSAEVVKEELAEV